MKLKVYFSVLTVLLFLSTGFLRAQGAGPEKIITPIGFDISDRLIDVTPIEPGYVDRSWKEKVIPNKDGFLEEFNVEAAWHGPDPVRQSNLIGNRSTAEIGQNFSGNYNQSGVAPPDTDGDVGMSHYMQMVNLSFRIWDKNGNPLYGPAANSTLWDGFVGPWTGTNDGDPIVLYDQYADRWIATQFSLPTHPYGPYYELIAVSQTNDPTGAWYRYAYEFANMPDYPKFGVWPDGYYLTVNQFASGSLSFAGAAVCVLNRAAMINGDPTAQMLFFNLGTTYGSLLPADVDGPLPPAGSPNYLASLGTNSLRIWAATIDWVNTGNSSVTLIQTLTTQAYSYSNIVINQPGTAQTLDPLATRLMYRLQYRNFGTYEAMVTNHTVNADGNHQAGVRWYELRKTGTTWGIHQQGTYAPADGNDRWMASVAMNANGDIAVGYSVSSASTYPSIRVAGQTAANSGSGLLDVAETTIVAGTSSQTGVNRWGDYSMMSVDPTNDSTFWYTNEYSGGGWNWLTRVASFNFPASAEITYCNSSGSNTSSEWINSLTLGTYVNNSGNNSGYGDFTLTPVELISGTSHGISMLPGFSGRSRSEYWRVWIDYNMDGDFADSGEQVFASNAQKGTVSGTINIPVGLSGETRMRVSMKYNSAPGPCELYTYGEVEDYTLSLSLPIPQPPVANFSGSPTSLVIGGSVQFTDLSTNDPTSWSWTFEGGTPATSASQNPAVTYNTAGTFAVTLTVTNVEGSDTKFVDNYITVTEVAAYCESRSTSNALDYIKQVNVGTFSNPSGASYYSDFTGLTIDLAPGSTNSVSLTPNSTIQRSFWRIWIDFNGDGDFTDTGEQVFAANNVRGTASGSITIPTTASGLTRMRVTQKVGGSPTSCEIFTNGEVEDYTVNFGNAPVIAVKPAELNLDLYPNPASGELNVRINSASEKVNIKVYNALGQILDDFDVKNDQVKINLGAYPNGIYYIGADDGKQTTLKKFFKE